MTPLPAPTVALVARTAASPSPSPETPDLLKPLDLEGDPTDLSWWIDLLGGPVLRTIAIILGALVFRLIVNRLIVGVVRGWTSMRDTEVTVVGPTAPAREVLGKDLLKAQRRAGRAATLGRLMSNASSVIIMTIAFLMILAEWGFDMGPLLAGAGVIGLAIGFGAQSLVSDFLSGVFMLLEDQFGVGDIIEVDGKAGTVEDVHLRVTRMRSVNGTVWWIRNGEIKRVGNMSQNWSRALLDISVAYQSDLARVRTVMAEEAAALRADEAWAPLMISDAEVWGVEDLASDGVVMRVVLNTVAGEQWKVARELRERIKVRFDAEGIEIPFPQRAVWIRTEAPA